MAVSRDPYVHPYAESAHPEIASAADQGPEVHPAASTNEQCQAKTMRPDLLTIKDDEEESELAYSRPSPAPTPALPAGLLASDVDANPYFQNGSRAGHPVTANPNSLPLPSSPVLLDGAHRASLFVAGPIAIADDHAEPHAYARQAESLPYIHSPASPSPASPIYQDQTRPPSIWGSTSEKGDTLIAFTDFASEQERYRKSQKTKEKVKIAIYLMIIIAIIVAGAIGIGMAVDKKHNNDSLTSDPAKSTSSLTGATAASVSFASKMTLSSDAQAVTPTTKLTAIETAPAQVQTTSNEVESTAVQTTSTRAEKQGRSSDATTPSAITESTSASAIASTSIEAPTRTRVVGPSVTCQYPIVLDGFTVGARATVLPAGSACPSEPSTEDDANERHGRPHKRGIGRKSSNPDSLRWAH